MDRDTSITIRSATINDAPGIVRVHIACWRTTYPGIIPQDYLNTLSAERRLAMWQSVLTDPVKAKLICVAVSERGVIIGFASGGPSRSLDFSDAGEIYALYLLKEHQGKGIGNLLFKRIIEMLLEQNFSSMLLWVLTDNPTRGFYERHEGKLVTSKTIEIGGETLDEVAYQWDDLTLIGK